MLTKMRRRALSWDLFALMALLGLASVAPVAADPRVGAYELGLSPRELIGERAAAYADSLDPDARIVWDVYAPAASDEPPGLFVFISPLPSGAPPEAWRAVLDAHNLIWIGARQSGNEVLTRKRYLMAFLAVAAIGTEREINADRVYVSGFSGGGRVASLVASGLPRIFHGAMYFAGVDWSAPNSAEQRAQMRANRYVFVTGRSDFNRRETRRVYSQYRNADFEHSLLMDLDYLGHGLPRSEDFDAGLRFLDRRAPSFSNP